MSIAIGSVIFQNEMQSHVSELASGGAGANNATLISGLSAAASVGAINDLSPSAQVSVRHAYWESIRTLWILYAAVGAVGVLVSVFIAGRPLEVSHEVTKTGLQSLQTREASSSERRAQGAVDKQVV